MMRHILQAKEQSLVVADADLLYMVNAHAQLLWMLEISRLQLAY